MAPDADAFGLKASTVEGMNAVFAAFPGVEQAIVYGSRAKGNYQPGSDIDLCLVGPDLDLSQLLKIDVALDDLLLPYKIDLSLRAHIDDPALQAHIERHGLPFYRRAA